MKYKEKLSFPDGECELSSHGKIFIQSLLCDNTSRLSYEQIITDDFLHDVDLDRIRNSTPPIIPKVTGVADTSNFDECEPRHPSPRQHLDDQLEFRDVPFIGFTSYRNIALLKASHRGSVNSPSLLDSLMPSSPAGRGSISLERKESQLKQELEALREDSLQKSHKMSRLEKTIHKQREDISFLTATNDSLNETNERLTASLEATKQVYDDLTSQTEDFLSVLKSKEDERNEYESYQSQELDYSKSEVERLDKLNVEKDVAILSLQKKVKRLEEECSSLASDLSQERKKRAVRQASTQSNGGSNTVVIKCEIETQQQKLYKQNNETVTELLQQLDKVQEFNRATKDSIDKMRDEKEDLERQLRSIREVSARRETDRQTQQEQSQLKQSPRPSSISEGDKRKLQQLEIRNSQLSSDVHEKSQQVNQLANQINDLAAQLESTMREAETEKRLRKEIETSLQNRIAELERELRQVKNSHDSLQRTRESAGDMKTHQTRTISDLENTIEILKASEDKLQALVAAQRDGFDEKIDRRDQKGRQETRRWAEIVGELKQENMFLERKLEQLNKRLETKDNFEQSYKDRLDAARNLGRQEKREREEEVGRLNKKILEMEMSHADLKSEHEKTSRSCRIFERKYTDLQNNVQTTERNYHQRVDDIQNEKNVLEHQIETLQEETALIDEYENIIESYKQKVELLDSENKTLKEETRKAVDSRTRSELSLSQLELERSQSDRKYEILKQEMEKMKYLCSQMELHIDDLEAVNEDLESRIKDSESCSTGRDIEIQRLLNKTERLEASLQAERQQRQSLDERKDHQITLLSSQISSYKQIEDKTRNELTQTRHQMDQLRRLLDSKDGDIRHLEGEKKSARIKYNQLSDELNRVKEEATTWKSQVENLKSENCKLVGDIEMIMDELDELQDKKYVVENSMENLILTKEHDKYKTEEIMSQQTKLIEYLQDKYQTPLKKKKSGTKLFSNKRRDGERDEFTNALESERIRNRKLRDEVKDLKTELLHTKVATLKGRDLSSLVSSDSGVDTITPVKIKPEVKSKPDMSKTVMRHNIPHRVSMGMNTRATKCMVCQQNVMFGRQAARCQECKIVTHEQCRHKLTDTCGIPSQFIRLYEKTVEKQRNYNSAGGVLEADLKLIQLGAWMKVCEQTAVWERRFVLLENETLSFYVADDTSTRPLSHCNLRTDNRTSIHLISDVNPAELTQHTASADVPYIIKLDICTIQRSRVQGSRPLYLMCASFEEKEKWDSTLEGIITRGNMNSYKHDSALLGNRLLRLDGSARIEVNCSLLVGEQDFLVLGAESGLFAVRLALTSQPMIKIEGVNSVYQITRLNLPDLLLMVSGSRRTLCTTSYNSLRDSLSSCENTISGHIKAQCTGLLGITNCTLYCVNEDSNSCTIVAADSESLFVAQYSNKRGQFSIIQEVDLSEPVSCLYWIPDSVLYGTDKVYKMIFHTGVVRPFLSGDIRQIETYKTFPIEILSISEDELLLAYTDFGVFVNLSGQKTRNEDIQWAGVPLSFAYRSPYLYVIYYKAVQIIGPLDAPHVSWRNLQTFLNIQSPRYLGPAYTEGAIYISSLHEQYNDILVFKGNLTVSADYDSDATSISSTETNSSIDSRTSEEIYLSQERTAREYFQKENRPMKGRHAELHHAMINHTPLRRLVMSPQVNESSADESLPVRHATPTNLPAGQTPPTKTTLSQDYYGKVYGLKNKSNSNNKPQHSNV